MRGFSDHFSDWTFNLDVPHSRPPGCIRSVIRAVGAPVGRAVHLENPKRGDSTCVLDAQVFKLDGADVFIVMLQLGHADNHAAGREVHVVVGRSGLDEVTSKLSTDDPHRLVKRAIESIKWDAMPPHGVRPEVEP